MDAAKTEELMAELRAMAREAEQLVQASGVEDQVRKNPWTALAVAAGVGLVIGLLLARK